MDPWKFTVTFLHYFVVDTDVKLSVDGQSEEMDIINTVPVLDLETTVLSLGNALKSVTSDDGNTVAGWLQTLALSNIIVIIPLIITNNTVSSKNTMPSCAFCLQNNDHRNKLQREYFSLEGGRKGGLVSG